MLYPVGSQWVLSHPSLMDCSMAQEIPLGAIDAMLSAADPSW